MDSDPNVPSVKFWFVVKTMMRKLEEARQTAIEAFIEASLSDPATAKGDPTVGSTWKTKLDAAEKPWNDQLAPLAGVLTETESRIHYLFQRNEEEVERAFTQLKKESKKELEGEEGEIDQLWKALEAQKAQTARPRQTAKSS